MHPAHVGVSIIAALCGIGALIGHYGPIPGLLFPSVFFGWWATMGAMLIALILAIVVIYRAFSKTARPLIARHWLGFLNGGVALIFWVFFISSMSANHSLQTDREPAAELKR
jgi:hypothetical protein